MSANPNDPNANRRIVRKYRIGEEPVDDLTPFTTAEERFELVRELSGRLVEFRREPVPHYSRNEIPVLVIRPLIPSVFPSLI